MLVARWQDRWGHVSSYCHGAAVTLGFLLRQLRPSTLALCFGFFASHLNRTVGTYFLALLSRPHLHGALEPRLWRVLRTVAMEYVALVLATDFIVLRLQLDRVDKYAVSYLPFALLLIAGVGPARRHKRAAMTTSTTANSGEAH